jgi:hypothetical protein
MATPAPLGPPPDEATYKDLQAVKAALQEHAGHHGYSITVTSSREQRAVYMCSKGGNYDGKGKKQDVHESRRRQNTSTMKTGCRFSVVAKKCDSPGQEGYKVEVQNNNHNHGPVEALSALPQHRLAAMKT